MPIRYVLTKASATGEQITTEVAQCDPVTGQVMHSDAQLEMMLERAIKVSDERMIHMNMLMLEAMKLHTYCDEQTWIKLRQLLEVLCGRMQAAVLAARWQSEIEETADLEAGRQRYAEEQERLVKEMQDSAPQLVMESDDIVSEHREAATQLAFIDNHDHRSA